MADKRLNITPFANPADAYKNALRNMPLDSYDPYGGMTDEEALRQMRSPEFVAAMAEASEGISPDPCKCRFL